MTSHIKKYFIIHRKFPFPCMFSISSVKSSGKQGKHKLAPYLADKHQVAHSDALGSENPPIISQNLKPRKPRQAKKNLNSENNTVVQDLVEIRNLLENKSDNENWHL